MGSMSATQGVGGAKSQQRQQSMKDLFAALKSGDLGAAQKAYAGLSSGGSAVAAGSALAQIGKALGNGDLAGAQQLAQAMRSGHGGHHHAASSDPQTASAAGGAPGSLINLTA